MPQKKRPEENPPTNSQRLLLWQDKYGPHPLFLFSFLSFPFEPLETTNKKPLFDSIYSCCFKLYVDLSKKDCLFLLLKSIDMLVLIK